LSEKIGWPTISGLVLVILIALLFEAILFPYLVDDSFISYRYAANLEAGRGLVFNPGEKVEGYSNFLWVVLLAGFMSMGASPILVSKILGVFLSIGSLIFVFFISRNVSEKKGPFVLASVLLTAIDMGFARWSVAGMETQLAGFLLLASLFFFMRENEAESLFPVSGFLLGLLSLTRPEAPLLFVAALCVRLWKRRRKWSHHDTIWIITYAMISVPHLLFRFSYYGSLFPNSYYAKVGGGLKRIIVGMRYSNQFFAANGGFALLPLIALPFISGNRKVSWLYPFVIAQLFFIVYVGGDHMDDFRFFVPIVGIIFILVQEGLLELANLLRRWKVGVLLLLLVSLVFSNLLSDYFATAVSWWGDSKGQLARLKTGTVHPEKLYDRAQVGLWLKENVKPHKVVAVEDCGMIPYYSGLETIDMFGLMDIHLAHLEGMMHQKFDASYVLHRKPDIIVLIRYPEWLNGEPFWQSKVDRDLSESTRFRREYALLHRAEGRTRWFLIYERRQGV
jgi:arabinofuranosyltransferase